MKDQNNKTKSICFCKDNQQTEKFAPKEEIKEVEVRNTIKTRIGEGTQPWSMFDKWYWI